MLNGRIDFVTLASALLFIAVGLMMALYADRYQSYYVDMARKNQRLYESIPKILRPRYTRGAVWTARIFGCILLALGVWLLFISVWGPQRL